MIQIFCDKCGVEVRGDYGSEEAEFIDHPVTIDGSFFNLCPNCAGWLQLCITSETPPPKPAGKEPKE